MTLAESVAGRLIFAALNFFRSKCTAILKQHVFSIAFVDHDPPGSSEIAPWNLHSIPLGRSEHWIKVVTAEGYPVSDVNVRFLSVEEATAKPGNAPASIASIIEILDVCVSDEIEQHGHTVTRTKDRHGGIDLKFRPSYAWGTGRALFLKLTVDAKQVWSGKISFRGYDKNYCRIPRYARADVRVVDIK